MARMRPLSPHVLIVDNDSCGADQLALLLEVTLGHAEVVPDAYQALSRLAEARIDAIVTELVLPGAGGLDLLARIDPSIPVFVVTALYSEPVAARARAAGARAVLAKPVDGDKLVEAVRASLTAPAGTGSHPDVVPALAGGSLLPERPWSDDRRHEPGGRYARARTRR